MRIFAHFSVQNVHSDLEVLVVGRDEPALEVLEHPGVREGVEVAAEEQPHRGGPGGLQRTGREEEEQEVLLQFD